MYQHHILLRTDQPIDVLDAIEWYNTVKTFGPPNIVYPYQFHGKDVAMEYGLYPCNELAHAYSVPLVRDLTSDEALFIVSAWETIYCGDFDIELSSSYDNKGMGDFQNTIEYDIDESLMTESTQAMNKWEHNRWLDKMISEGWRWGQYYNSKQKTHPALRDWDTLPESHRRIRPVQSQEIYEWLKKQNIFK